MKKIIAVLVMVMICCMTLAVGGFITDKSDVANADSITGADVYFIAGQSNAAGCSDFYRNDNATYNLSGEWLKKAKNAKYTNGFANVSYFGFGGVSSSESGGTRFLTELVPVKVAQGSNYVSEFGPELGMAEYLSTHYGPGSENPNRVAVIVKYAVGAASLIGESGASWCSWCAPSYQKANNITIFGQDLYHNMVGTSSDYSTGVVYKAFNAMKAKGYTDIDLKGFYWSQGEAECNSSDYAKHGPALEAFITDMRKDLDLVSSSFMSTNTSVNIAGATDLDFLISEIAPTFGGSYTLNGTTYNTTKLPDGTSSNPFIREVVKAQQSVAQKLSNVYTLPTRDYTIFNESANLGIFKEDGKSYCGDQWHYNADDMLAIGNEVSRTLYAINSVKSSSVKVNVKAFNDDGQETEIKELSLVAGDTYTANVVDGVANFTNIPVGTFDIVADGFKHADDEGNFIQNYRVNTKANSTVTANVTMWELPFALDDDAINYWSIKTDPVHGASITASNTERIYLGIGTEAKGVAFKYSYTQRYEENNGTKTAASTYFPAIYAQDDNGNLAGIQLCHWGKGFSLKANSIGISNQTSLGTVTSGTGMGTAEIYVYFEGTTVYYSVTNVMLNYDEMGELEGSYDLKSVNANFTGAKNISFSYNNDVGKTGSLDGIGTADPWRIFDIQPIKNKSTSLATVKLNVVGKNIRAVNGVSDVNLDGKIAILSSAGGLNNYAGTVLNGVATFNNVPFGKYELKVDNAKYVGLEKVVVDSTVVDKKVRVNNQLLVNHMAGASATMHGDMDWDNQYGYLTFDTSNGDITYAEMIVDTSLINFNESFIIGFSAMNSSGVSVDFGLRFVPSTHGENISKNGDEWQIRVSNAYWSRALINQFQDDSYAVVKLKAWIKDGAVFLGAFDAETDAIISDFSTSPESEESAKFIVRNDGYTTFHGIHKQNAKQTVAVTGLKLGSVSDINPKTGESDASLWVEDIWPEVEEDEPILPDNGSTGGNNNNNNNDNTNDDNVVEDNNNNTENNNNQNQQQGMYCGMSTGEEYLLIAVVALFGASVLTIRKLKTKKD